MANSLNALAGKLGEGHADRLERLEFLVNSSPMVIYTCESQGDFRATFVSAGIKTLWGYEPEEFLDERGFWLARIHPADAPHVMGEIRRLFETGRHHHEYRFRTKTGEYRWVHDELLLVKGPSGEPLEIVGHCIDITERKAAEEALRESESRFKLIFNSTSDLQALFRVEPGNEFVAEALNRTLSDSLRNTIGRDATHFIGKSFTALLAATGLTKDAIEGRRAFYARTRDSGMAASFQTPVTGLREATEVYVYPVKDHSGRCTHLLWNGRIITDRLKAEAALRVIEERYALVTRATNDGIYDWDLITGKSYLSPRLKEILGYREEEMPNDWESFCEHIHPDDAPAIRQTVNRLNAETGLNQWNDELRLRCKDGGYRTVISRGTSLRDSTGRRTRVVGSICDLTERKEAAAQLDANKKRLRDIVNSLDTFVGLYSLDGSALEINRASLALGGFRPEDVLGKKPWETPWCTPEERATVQGAMAKAAGGEIAHYEGSVYTSAGRQLIVDVTFTPLRDEAGTIVNIIGFGVDITQRKEAETELRLAKQMAEASSRAKSEFLANMSHEIRTPMNGIIGLTGVVLESELNAEQREYLESVKTSAESLLMIITDILDISKLQAGKMILQPKEFWLKDMMNATLKAYLAVAEEKKVSLTWTVGREVPELWLGDSTCLRQVLRNLVGNAIKFTETGEVSVAATCDPENPGLLHFLVRDTGVGVPEAKQHIIFEPFSQVDGSSHREFGGTGLGLAIAAQLVEMMGGQIWVESDGKTGSTFQFTVRMEAVAKNPAERRREIRVSADQPAWVEEQTPAGRVRREARIEDISQGGMKLRSAERLQPGTTVQIHTHDATLRAEVRYSVSSANGFWTGLKLLDS